MGTAAVAALASGDRVVGTMPRSLLESEPPFSDVTERVVVECMHERKKQMSRPRGRLLVAAERPRHS